MNTSNDSPVSEANENSTKKVRTLTIELEEELAQALLKKAQSIGISPRQYIQKVLYKKLLIEPRNLPAQIGVILGAVSVIGTEYIFSSYNFLPYLLDCFLSMIGLLLSVISLRSRLSFRPLTGIILSVIGLLKLIFFYVSFWFVSRS